MNSHSADNPYRSPGGSITTPRAITFRRLLWAGMMLAGGIGLMAYLYSADLTRRSLGVGLWAGAAYALTYAPFVGLGTKLKPTHYLAVIVFASMLSGITLWIVNVWLPGR